MWKGMVIMIGVIGVRGSNVEEQQMSVLSSNTQHHLA